MAYGAGLESQLGAISQGFESLILRQNCLNYAVAVGFEPTEDISTFTRFRGVYLWPLRHTTKEILIILQKIESFLYFLNKVAKL